ncbi:hypothetical protein L228DRAFT_268211 [Xylona heveae TC161]|uniref:Uncharacterized protein n=1 Tax=Xylona heveae (strain CBS 132557 / TC161) TaxID=1328760 RepID=A0A165H0D1_XYLHT|nr:hypothetical protein L228DRAFT_268211 [Xylona heveae TC161]KZF22829.1 hypothetical protein L228DRAFT_268211 [Xylona heveae TC161]
MNQQKTNKHPKENMSTSSFPQSGPGRRSGSAGFPSPDQSIANAYSDGGMQRFTATGRPMPKQAPFSALSNLPSGFTAQAPQLLPWKFRDSDKIMVPIPIDEDDDFTDEAFPSVTHDEDLRTGRHRVADNRGAGGSGQGGSLDQFARGDSSASGMDTDNLNANDNDNYDQSESPPSSSSTDQTEQTEDTGSGSGSGNTSSSRSRGGQQAGGRASGGGINPANAFEQQPAFEPAESSALLQQQALQQQEAVTASPRRALATSFVDKFFNVARSIVHKPMTASSSAATVLESSVAGGLGGTGGMLSAVPKDQKSLALLTLLTTASTSTSSALGIDGADEDDDDKPANEARSRRWSHPTARSGLGGSGSTGIGGSDVYNNKGVSVNMMNTPTVPGTIPSNALGASGPNIISTPQNPLTSPTPAISSPEVTESKTRRTGWWKRSGGGTSNSNTKTIPSLIHPNQKKAREKKYQIVQMTRGEYLKYWAKDEQGRYCGTEPEGKGRELWRERLRAAREASGHGAPHTSVPGSVLRCSFSSPGVPGSVPSTVLGRGRSGGGSISHGGGVSPAGIPLPAAHPHPPPADPDPGDPGFPDSGS